jgi:hypothetical protein
MHLSSQCVRTLPGQPSLLLQNGQRKRTQRQVLTATCASSLMGFTPSEAIDVDNENDEDTADFSAISHSANNHYTPLAIVAVLPNSISTRPSGSGTTTVNHTSLVLPSTSGPRTHSMVLAATTYPHTPKDLTPVHSVCNIFISLYIHIIHSRSIASFLLICAVSKGI